MRVYGKFFRTARVVYISNEFFVSFVHAIRRRRCCCCCCCCWYCHSHFSRQVSSICFRCRSALLVCDKWHYTFVVVVVIHTFARLYVVDIDFMKCINVWTWHSEIASENGREHHTSENQTIIITIPNAFQWLIFSPIRYVSSNQTEKLAGKQQQLQTADAICVLFYFSTRQIITWIVSGCVMRKKKRNDKWRKCRHIHEYHEFDLKLNHFHYFDWTLIFNLTFEIDIIRKWPMLLLQHTHTHAYK